MWAPFFPGRSRTGRFPGVAVGLSTLRFASRAPGRLGGPGATHFMLQEKLFDCSVATYMKSAAPRESDAQLVAAHAAGLRGVFSKADLQVLLGERHPAAFLRRVDALIASGSLRRFVRGLYVHGRFDLPTLSQ